MVLLRAWPGTARAPDRRPLGASAAAPEVTEARGDGSVPGQRGICRETEDEVLDGVRGVLQVAGDAGGAVARLATRALPESVRGSVELAAAVAPGLARSGLERAAYQVGLVPAEVLERAERRAEQLERRVRDLERRATAPDAPSAPARRRAAVKRGAPRTAAADAATEPPSDAAAESSRDR